MSEKFQVLKDILDEFCREAGDLDERIEQRKQSIRENDIYVASLLESETEDFKVFSPRKAEIIYKEELDKAREKKSDCEAEIRNMCQRRNLLGDYAEKLKAVLEYLRQESWMCAEKAENLQKESVKKFTCLAERVEEIGNDLDKRPIQAKQDLVIIARDLREVTEKIEKTVWIEGK